MLLSAIETFIILHKSQSHIAKLQGLYNGLSSNGVLIAIFTAIAGTIYPTSPAMTFVLMSIIALAAGSWSLVSQLPG